MKVKRIPTEGGAIYRFHEQAPRSAAAPTLSSEAINLNHSERGAHVVRLTAALNDWWSTQVLRRSA